MNVAPDELYAATARWLEKLAQQLALGQLRDELRHAPGRFDADRYGRVSDAYAAVRQDVAALYAIKQELEDYMLAERRPTAAVIDDLVGVW